MHLENIATDSALESLASEWNQLSGHVPFRSWQWLGSWWRHYGPGYQLSTLAIRDQQGQLIGLAPLCLDVQSSRGRVLQLLGSGEACSDYLDLLARPGSEQVVVQAVAGWLADPLLTGSSHWDLLHLDGIAGEQSLLGQVVERLEIQGHTVHRRATQSCWRIELPDRWETYKARLSKSHRKQVRRVEQRLFDTGRAVLKCASTQYELRQFMGLLVDLHQRRRRQLGQPGCFASPHFTAFLADAAEQLLAHDQLRLYVLELDGRPVAADFNLFQQGVIYSYQAGLEPDALEEEPGRLVTVATLKQAIVAGARGLDFLRGDEPYKAHWRAEPVPCWEVRVVARSATAQLRHSIWLAGATLKQWVRGGTVNPTGLR